MIARHVPKALVISVGILSFAAWLAPTVEAEQVFMSCGGYQGYATAPAECCGGGVCGGGLVCASCGGGSTCAKPPWICCGGGICGDGLSCVRMPNGGVTCGKGSAETPVVIPNTPVTPAAVPVPPPPLPPAKRPPKPPPLPPATPPSPPPGAKATPRPVPSNPAISRRTIHPPARVTPSRRTASTVPPRKPYTKHPPRKQYKAPPRRTVSTPPRSKHRPSNVIIRDPPR